MKRIMLKLSGEALAGEQKTGLNEDAVREVALQVKEIVDSGVQVAIVTGGGNFWRGRTSGNIERTHADQIGMLATIMNCTFVSEVFRSVGLKTSLYTPFMCGTISELFSKDKALNDLEEGKVVFFAGGTGHPYFTTDTCTVLRAIEIEADTILLAKSIDGIYDDDPSKNPNAKKYKELTIKEVVDKRLAAMDLTASIMALENKMPFFVFAMNEENSIIRAVQGDIDGTYVKA